MFVLDSGVKLGLWARHDVQPPSGGGSGGELCFPTDGDGAVDALFQQWKKRGLSIAQPPTRMDFGYTFLALDPDGHRLRVFAPAQ